MHNLAITYPVGQLNWVMIEVSGEKKRSAPSEALKTAKLHDLV
jgi:hypothetical protein